MLCDQIAVWADKNLADLPLEMIQTYRAIAGRIGLAQRFVLNREAVMTVHSVSESTPRRFMQALSVCRLPYPSIWVEFAFQDRMDWLKEAQSRGLRVEEHKEASPPSRLGFLMEQPDKDGVITVYPCWSHPRMDTISFCHLALTLRLHDGSFQLSGEDEQMMRDQLKSLPSRKVYNRWMDDEDEMRAGFELEARIGEDIPPILAPLWKTIFAIAPQEEIEHLRDLARYDLKSEWRFVMSLLAVLNSRNVVEVGPNVDQSRINKARIKKGVPPLLSHREIRLNMSRVQKRRLGGVSGVHAIQNHLVRGHFKLRAKGLFWWNPHVRGSIGDAQLSTTFVRG